MTLAVTWTTAITVDARRTAIDATFTTGSTLDRLLIHAKIGNEPTWPVVHYGPPLQQISRFAPAYREHSSANMAGGAGDFSILPIGGWVASPIVITAEDTVSDDDAYTPAEGEALDRFEPINVVFEVVTASIHRVLVKAGTAPWSWSLAWDGSDFAPLFAARSSFTRGGLEIAPLGGWWSRPDDPLTVQVVRVV
jgi:hypothetical protein